MADTAPTIRPLASVVRVHDGDSYLMLLDLHARGLEEDGCETAWIRLRNYSARELTDTAATDPKGLGRVDGPTARDLASKALAAAKQVTVELVGPAGPAGDTFGRYVASVYVDGQDLGAVLAAESAVSAGKFEGITRKTQRLLAGAVVGEFQAGGIVPGPVTVQVGRGTEIIGTAEVKQPQRRRRAR